MIINRNIEESIKNMSGKYPVITITGPRQSGKTTLAKAMFPDFQYFSLEDPDIRELALTDPRKFLSKIKIGIILDEIQRAPVLLSYIQTIVDSENNNNRFILTGSHQFELLDSINQSLAGRTVIFKLMPFSIDELRKLKKRQTLNECLLQGFYPGIHDKKIEPLIAYKNYFETYIERDLRQIVNIKDLRLFRKFVKLCAGRIGQIVSAASLANDTGVSVPTINSWLSTLEASYIILLLEPFYENVGKRLIKSPKIYFYDTGLASYLLGIETENQMERDPLKGSLFENLIVMEIVKHRFNLGLDYNCFFYRDSNGNEVDILYRTEGKFIPIEIKSADTYTNSFLKGLKYFKKIYPEKTGNGFVIYSGKLEKSMGHFTLLNYEHLNKIFE